MVSLTDCDVLAQVSHIVTSVPSILGGLFVLVSFALTPKIRTASFGLILATAMCDSLFSVVWLFPVPEDRTFLCRLQGWWIQFFPVASVYFSLLTTVHIYLMITRSRGKHLKKQALLGYSVLLLSLAFVGSMVPLATDQYGLMGKSCWIALDEDGRDGHTGKAFRFGLSYVIVWTICAVNFVLYRRVFQYTMNLSAQNMKCSVSGAGGDSVSAGSSERSRATSTRSVSSAGGGGNKVMQVVLRLRWYPVIMFACWTGLILVRLYQWYSMAIPCWVIVSAQNMLNLQGLWNSVVFASTDTVWQAWYALFGWSIHSAEEARPKFYRPNSSSSGSSSNSSSGLLHTSSATTSASLLGGRALRSDEVQMRESSNFSVSQPTPTLTTPASSTTSPSTSTSTSTPTSAT